MKKLLLFVTMAASLLFTQCKKDDKNSMPSEGKTVKMTVTAGPGSKTDITPDGAIKWSEGDKLYVGDGKKYIGYLTLVGDGGSATGVFTGNVTLDIEKTEVDDSSEDGGQTFHFFYLGNAKDYDKDLTSGKSTTVNVDFSKQDIKVNNGKLVNASKYHVGYGSAKGTVTGNMVTDINVMMESKVAIAHFSFKFKKGDSEEDYEGALTLSGDNICDNMKVSFDKPWFYCEGPKGDISLTNTETSEKYVMLVPTEKTAGSQTLTFTGDNVSGSYTLANGIEANKFYGMKDAIEVPLKASAPATPVFTVGKDDNDDPITVEFAPGNLYWDGSAFKFEENQWNFADSWDENHVSHFYWSNTTDWQTSGKEPYASKYSYSTRTTSDEFFTNSSSFHVDGEAADTWRTLSNAEWTYLLNTRADASSFRAFVNLTDVDVSGLVILPDGSEATASTVTTTALVASSGAVFLPIAGSRDGMEMSDVMCCYWSGTPTEDDNTMAYGRYFASTSVFTLPADRLFGYAVRLVRLVR